MFDNARIAVVIPCYRVEQTIARVVETLPDFVDLVVMVDDASPDATGETIDRLATNANGGATDIVALHHNRNQGVGGAMATGYAEALERGADIVVKVDGDDQMRPDFMVELIEPLAVGICDYAKGNRFRHFRALKAMPLVRKLGNIALTFLTKVASGYWHVFDPQNGYVAIHRDMLQSLDLECLRSRRYFFENEMLIRLNIESARVLDVPMPSVYGDEVSSLRVSHVLAYFPMHLTRGFVARLFHRYVLRDFSVVIPLYLIGFLAFAWGFGFGLAAWIDHYSHPDTPTPTGTVMLSVLPLIVGLQMLLQGLLIDILQTPRPDAAWPRRRRGPAHAPRPSQ